MATRTTTKPNKVVSREELAASVPTANVKAVGSELAPLFRAKGTFDMCRIAYSATVEGGLKGEQVANATTEAVADLIHADLIKAGAAKATADKARTDALVTSVAKGGAQVSRTAIVQRASAWSDVVEAGIVPTEAVVEVAYKITTTGGSGDARKAIIAAVKRESPAKRANSYIRRVTDALVILRKGNRDKTAESSATASADDKAETVVEEVTLDGVDEIVSFLRATVARKWNDDDKATLVAALSEAISTLS